MAIKELKRPPVFAHGAGVTESLHSSLYMAVSDTFAVGDTLPVTLFKVYKDTYIYDVLLDVETAFADSGSGATLICGYNGDSDAFIADTTAVTVGSYSMHGATGGVKKGGYLCTGDMTVECSWATTCSVGGGQARIIFKPYGTEEFVENP